MEEFGRMMIPFVIVLGVVALFAAFVLRLGRTDYAGPDQAPGKRRPRWYRLKDLNRSRFDIKRVESLEEQDHQYMLDEEDGRG